MGDSTFILQGLIERGIGGIALGGIWDPGAVQLCFDAGVGAKFLMRIGGKTGPASGLPTDVTAQVMALVPDHSQDDFGARANLGGVLLVDTPGLLSTDFANIPFKNRSPVFWPRSENAH